MKNIYCAKRHIQYYKAVYATVGTTYDDENYICMSRHGWKRVLHVLLQTYSATLHVPIYTKNKKLAQYNTVRIE